MRLSIVFAALLAATWIVPAAAQAKINIFACEPEWAGLAKELTGKAANVVSAVDGQQDPRVVEITDKLVSEIKKANLVICSGSGLEDRWLPDLLKKTPNPSIQMGASANLMTSNYVIPLGQPATLEDETPANSPDQDTLDADAGTGGNPHVHLNPHNIMLVAEELQKRLTEIDPDNRSLYDKLYNSFFNRWQDAMDNWEQQAAGLFGVRVATEDDSWAYLIDWLGLVKVATIEDTPGKQPDAADVKVLIAKLKKRPVRAILRTPFGHDSATKEVSSAVGAPIMVLPYTVGGDKESDDLFALFDQTLKMLERLRS